MKQPAVRLIELQSICPVRNQMGRGDSLYWKRAKVEKWNKELRSDCQRCVTAADAAPLR